MSSSTDVRATSRILRGRDAEVIAPALLGDTLVACGPGEANSVDPRLREKSMAEGRQAGYEEGYRAGYEEAHVVAAAMIENALTALTAAADEFRTRENFALEYAESRVAESIVEISEAILGREISMRENPGQDALARALQLAPIQGDLIIRMNPADVSTIDQTILDHTGRAYKLVPDASIEPAGCVIDSGATRIDAQLSTALERVREVMQ